MSKLQLAADEFRELLDVAEEVEELDHGRWRHGHSTRFRLVHEGKSYAVWVEIHSEEGMQLPSKVTLTEVRPVQKTVTVWEEVPE